MGATCWVYFTPYHPSPAVALDRLRREVFGRGDYRHPARFRRWLHLRMAATPEADRGPLQQSVCRIEQALMSGSTATLTEDEKRNLDVIRRMRVVDALLPDSLTEHQTVEDLLRAAAVDGTHSILDITHIAEGPEHAGARPVAAGWLEAAFGTAQPTREQIDVKGLWSLAGAVERCQAVYLTVYREGQPNEYAFAGSSGD